MKEIPLEEWHQSQRGYFAGSLYNEMIQNPDIWLITADLGYGMFDKIKNSFPKRFLNTGASEQAAMGIAVGLALSGKIPVVYSITPFLLYRPFETIRNYLNHEEIPVKLIGSGRNQDYEVDGRSHWAEEDREVMHIFRNIESRWPRSFQEIPNLVQEMIKSSKPWYLNLER